MDLRHIARPVFGTFASRFQIVDHFTGEPVISTAAWIFAGAELLVVSADRQTGPTQRSHGLLGTGRNIQIEQHAFGPMAMDGLFAYIHRQIGSGLKLTPLEAGTAHGE